MSSLPTILFLSVWLASMWVRVRHLPARVLCHKHIQRGVGRGEIEEKSRKGRKKAPQYMGGKK